MTFLLAIKLITLLLVVREIFTETKAHSYNGRYNNRDADSGKNGNSRRARVSIGIDRGGDKGGGKGLGAGD